MLGIDVSKAQLACALLDRATEQFHWERSVPNTPAGVRSLLALTPSDVPLVVEPTGRYSELVAREAHAAGRTVLLAPPRKAKAYLRSLTTRAKTDRLDGRGLAMFGASRPKAEALRPYPLKSEDVQRLDQLLAARRGVTAALVALEQQGRELTHAAPVLAQAASDLRARRQQLDAQIAQLARDQQKFPAAARLQQVPGVGPVIAATVAARLTSHDFARADQFVAYMGLDVGVVSSGKRQGQRGLTKEGDAELRRLFYLAAQSNLRAKQSPFRAQYERYRARGMTSTAALNAVARKLARVCWSLVKHGGSYDPSRVNNQATTSEQPQQWVGTTPGEPTTNAPADASPSPSRSPLDTAKTP
jgi:transposase